MMTEDPIILYCIAISNLLNMLSLLHQCYISIDASKQHARILLTSLRHLSSLIITLFCKNLQVLLFCEYFNEVYRQFPYRKEPNKLYCATHNPIGLALMQAQS